jgi:hypothetical protein
MKKILFVIANYKNTRQQFFEEHFSPRNKKFADIHGYEYIVSSGGNIFRGNPTWWKFTLVKEMLDNGTLQEGDELLHLDADMRIDKFDNEMLPGLKIFLSNFKTSKKILILGERNIGFNHETLFHKTKSLYDLDN